MGSDPVIRPQWILQGKILTKVCKNVKRIVVEGFKMQTVACKALTVLFI